ncbi:MAG TPA: DNA mismatch repair protein MutS [Candidatus Binatia bacterium]|jgi:hypothetical protein|nr:DNA mismatch repair protein MutS [Candidatus Binatia bacterium]
MTDPHVEYTSRLAARRDTVARLERTEERLGLLRLGCMVAAGVVAWWAIRDGAFSPAWTLVPLAVFAVLVARHWDTTAARQRAERAVAFYRRGLARLDGTWMGGGEHGVRFVDALHPYADDLDLFGAGSLFELLCTARTRAGEDTLAAWLRAPAVPDDVRSRQAAVDELRPRLDLREDMALLGADVRAGVDPDALRAWAQAPIVLTAPWARWLAPLLALLATGAAVAWALGDWVPIVVVGAVESVVALVLRRRVQHVVRAVEKPGRDLRLLAEMLARLEAERFTSPRLTALRALLDTDGQPPSRQIARLKRRIDLLDARRNQVFAPVGWLLLWTTQVALSLESWRAACGPSVAGWLAAVGEVEALCALAAYAWEHPEQPFPTLTTGPPSLDGRGLGHPLLAPGKCIRNDVRLGGDAPHVLVVSGSNMSGKSTLLRTVGLNAVLAQAGAPVPADALSLTPLTVGASIRVQDSLQAGTSRFYAEVTRIKQLVDLASGTPPLLFLLDEIFHGTNSHDRRIGAEAIVRGLVERGAIGFVTTHDLAVAHIGDELGVKATNVHFEDQLVDGRMTFDYRMRPGVVTKSNALALMRAVGLEV